MFWILLRPRRAFYAGVVLVACLMFTACYTANTDVITSQKAEPLPYTASTVDFQADGKLLLTRAPHSNDYGFRHTKSGDPHDRTGTIRGIRVKGDIYAIQMKYDDEASYDIMFCRLHANSFELLEPKSDDADKKLAAQDNVSFTGIAGTLTGEPAALLKFIRDHKDAEFKKFKE